MDDKHKTTLLEMIGTKSLEDLKAISSLFPETHGFADGYLLACHLLNCSIERCKKIIQQELGTK